MGQFRIEAQNGKCGKRATSKKKEISDPIQNLKRDRLLGIR